MPFGIGFLIGPLLTPALRRFVGNYLSAIGMGFETTGLAGLAWLIAHTHTGTPPVMLPLALLLFATGLGQGLAMPTLVRMVTGQVAPAFSGMIAGVTSSTLQISTALSVAIIGGIFLQHPGQRSQRSRYHPRLYRRASGDGAMPRGWRGAEHPAYPARLRPRCRPGPLFS
ncbi:hypothetical protein OJE16_00015 [Pantoea tagorei]